MHPKYIAMCSKLLEVCGFNDKEAAQKQVDEWNEVAKGGPNDCESPPAVMTWDEWAQLAKEGGFDPIKALDNSSKRRAAK